MGSRVVGEQSFSFFWQPERPKWENEKMDAGNIAAKNDFGIGWYLRIELGSVRSYFFLWQLEQTPLDISQIFAWDM